MAKGGMKEFGATIPVEEYEKFRKNFPQYGATQWLINEAVAQVNRLCDSNPKYVNIVGEAIREMLDERRSEGDSAQELVS